MAKNSRITVLLGAGAMLDAVDLSVKTITNKVIEKKQYVWIDGRGEEIPLLYNIYCELCKHYKNEKDTVNFEDIFHALEMLESLKTAQRPKTVKAYRSVFGMFCEEKDFYKDIDPVDLFTGCQDLITLISDMVGCYEQDCFKHPWFSEFFQALRNIAPLDVFTLTYDTWMEQILKDYNDGFVPICETHQKFSAKKLFGNEGELSTINHLHGQICFGARLPQNMRNEQRNGYYRVNDFEIILRSGDLPRYAGSMQATQSSEQIYQYSIITGLRKTDKVLSPPFDAYLTHFYQKLYQNSCLLVIGYGFGDLYINSLINQFREFHGEHGKVIFIDYLAAEKWHLMMYDMEISQEFKRAIYNTFQDEELPYRMLGWEKPDFIENEKKNSRVYLSGFKNAATEHLDEILKFYSE